MNTPAVMRHLGGVQDRASWDAAVERIIGLPARLRPHLVAGRAQGGWRTARLLRAEAGQFARRRPSHRPVRNRLAVARKRLGPGLCQGSGDRLARPCLRPLRRAACRRADDRSERRKPGPDEAARNDPARGPRLCRHAFRAGDEPDDCLSHRRRGMARSAGGSARPSGPAVLQAVDRGRLCVVDRRRLRRLPRRWLAGPRAGSSAALQTGRSQLVDVAPPPGSSRHIARPAATGPAAQRPSFRWPSARQPPPAVRHRPAWRRIAERPPAPRRSMFASPAASPASTGPTGTSLGIGTRGSIASAGARAPGSAPARRSAPSRRRSARWRAGERGVAWPRV